MPLKKNAVLGAFVILVLGLLTYFTFVIKGVALFEDRTEWTAYFGRDSVAEEGMEVVTSGKKVGRVESVRLLSADDVAEDRFVEVRMSLRSDLTLWRGTRVVAVRPGVLTQHILQVYRGDPDAARLDPSVPLQGSVRHGILERLGGVDQLAGEEREPLDPMKVLEDLAAMASDVRAIVEDVREGRGALGRILSDAEVEERIVNVVRILEERAEAIQRGEGAVGLLLADPRVREDLRRGIAALSSYAQDLERGEGIVSRLVRDKELADRLEATVDDIAATASLVRGGLERGEGIAGMLVTDSRARRELEQTVTALRDFAVDLREGRGVVGRLVRDEALADRVENVVANLEEVSAQVRAGRGTIGRLVMDDGVVSSLEAMLEEFREAGQVTRENAPLASLTSFTSMFFNVLN